MTDELEMEGEAEEPKKPKQESNLRALVDSYVAAQRERISWEHRVGAEKRGADLPPTPKYMQAMAYKEQFEAIEKRAFQEITGELNLSYPVYDWLKTVKGIGPTLSGKLLADIDFSIAQHVSSLWKFCGLAPGQRLVKGQKASYNTRLKVTCYLVARSFLLTSRLKEPSPYLKFYHEAKKRYQEREGWTKGHIEGAARRYMVKMFLSHLWIKGREAGGLPVTQPYQFTHLGHDQSGYIGPDDMRVV